MKVIANNLSTFKLLFLIKGILTLCISIIFIIYAGIGTLVGNLIEHSGEINNLPFNPGDIFLVVGGIGFIFTVTMGVLTLFVSKYIGELRNYNFIFVVAIINGLSGILGILLVVFTLIELTKPHIKELFGVK